MTAAVSIGIAAATGPDLAARIAPAIEAAGLRALWVNDTPGHDALNVLAAVAAVTDRLVLATGVLPVDRHGPDEILRRVADLPADRLVLGIGSGQTAKGALERVADAAAALRGRSSARIVVGALGPRMRRLGVSAADGLLLSWLTPELAEKQTHDAHAADPSAHVALYVRAAVDEDAVPALKDEAARYAGYPAYAANFTRLGIRADDTVIRPAALVPRVRDYRAAADEVVLRAITGGGVDAHLRFVDAVGAAAASR